jgi:hypothetical protein
VSKPATAADQKQRAKGSAEETQSKAKKTMAEHRPKAKDRGRVYVDQANRKVSQGMGAIDKHIDTSDVGK